MAIDLGTDFSCVNDIDADLSVVGGRLALGQSIGRRLQTSLGGLFYDPDYGFDLQRRIGSSVPAGSLKTLAGNAENECLKDERVDDVRVDLEFVEETQRMDATVNIDDGEGPFDLVISVSELGVEDLEIPEAT